MNTVIALMPGIARRLDLSTTLAGFWGSVWCFARVGTFPSVPIMNETTASLAITVEGMEVVERWRKQGCWE
jgi:hypothetical protein